MLKWLQVLRKMFGPNYNEVNKHIRLLHNEGLVT